MGEPKNDWSRWFHPKMIFAERVIPAGTTLDITADQTRVGRDTVIDLMALSEETLSTGKGVVSGCYISQLRVNYQITERPWWVNAGLAPVEAFHNLTGGDRSLDGWFPAAADRPFRWGRLQWQHAIPWIYNPNDTLTTEFSAPSLGQVNCFVATVFDGVGSVSGLRRQYQIPGLFAQTIPPFLQRYSDPQNGHNQGNEPFRMTSVGFVPTPTVNDPGGVDTRYLNVFRCKVMPSIGDSWSDRGVPLAFYGPHVSPPYRVAWHKPCGGPIYLRAGQGIILSIANDAAFDINVQFAALGRTAFGVGSVGP